MAGGDIGVKINGPPDGHGAGPHVRHRKPAHKPAARGGGGEGQVPR